MQTRSKTARQPVARLPTTPFSDDEDETSSVGQQSEFQSYYEGSEDDATPTPAARTIGSSKRAKATTDKEDRERALREYRHRPDYDNFVQEAGLRQQKRKYLAERNRIWRERRERNQAQIEAGEKQNEQLLKEIEMMNDAQEAHIEENDVSVSEEADRETHRKWEAFFDMETNELPSSD